MQNLRSSKRILFQRVDLGGQDKVVFRKAVDGMGPDIEADPVIMDMDVGMVSFLFGHSGRPVDKLHRFDKIFELELLDNPLAVKLPSRDLTKELFNLGFP